MTDVLYLIKPGERNDELRFSLRSLVNLPHDRVWFVGYRPRWVKDVEHIPGNRFKSKWLNVFDNLRLACESVTAEQFVVMNDDFFITQPVTTLPSWHRCSLADHIRVTRGPWKRSLEVTRDVLADLGFTDPQSYELHIPVPMDRAKLAAALDLGVDRDRRFPPQWRTMYGNHWNVASEPAPDCKLRTTNQPLSQEGAFLSTEDWTFKRVLPWLSNLFPQPSPYERAVA